MERIMEEDKLIQILFRSDEIEFYNIMEQLCINKGITITDYIKELIKKDLAWGQLRRRKKRDDGKG
jgi:hypothetical protein